MKEDLEKEYLNILFEYSEGQLYWKINKSFRVKMGDKAGKQNAFGYIQIKIDRKDYYAHRIVWVMHNGSIPKGMFIDHIDNDKSNNRISNLRLATKSQNGCNKPKNKNNTSGFKGVSFHKGIGKYVAQIKVNNKGKSLGAYNTAEDAALAYQKESSIIHKEFART